MESTKNNLDKLYQLLAEADATYRNLPPNMRLEIEKISRGLTEFGPRKLRRRGPGTDFFEARDFQRDSDDPAKINAPLSLRAGRKIVVEREAEIRQHFYLWRDATDSMEYRSKEDIYTKKDAAEIMLMALAKHLARNEEAIGILDGRGIYRGGKAAEWMGRKLHDVTIVAGGMPAMSGKLLRNSTVVLFGDFLMKRDELVNGLSKLTGMGLKGFLVMTLDPQEVDFKFRGHVEFRGLEGEGTKKFKKAESLRAAYQEKLKNHIQEVQGVCATKGFEFILQRTDQPLHEALLAIYGQPAESPERSPAPGM